MKSSYEINSDKRIIIETLARDINSDTYTKLKHDEFQNKKFNRNYNLIADFSSFDNNVSSSTLNAIFNIFKENKGKVNRTKSAIVVSDKKLLKGIDLKIKPSKKGKSEIKVFTSIEDSQKWVLK